MCKAPVTIFTNICVKYSFLRHTVYSEVSILFDVLYLEMHDEIFHFEINKSQ